MSRFYYYGWEASKRALKQAHKAIYNMIVMKIQGSNPPFHHLQGLNTKMPHITKDKEGAVKGMY
jgi:hypothetical protein